MTSQEPSNPVVHRLVAAINDGHMNVEHEMAGLRKSEISHPARRHIRGVSQPAAQVLDSAASPAAS